MKKVGYCVTGLGIGRNHLAAAAKNPNVGYIAVCDIDEKRIDAVKAKYPDIVCYTSFDEMLKDEKIDIVSICLPSAMHADFAVKALEAGKHILCEKPIDISVEKAQLIEDARIRTGNKVGVIFQIRNNPIMQEAKKAIDEGRFGKLIVGDFAVKWNRDQAYYDAGGWRGTWAMDGGGSLMNQSVHTVDIMQWFFGDVESVRGVYKVANHKIETEDLTASVITFKNGAVVTFISTTCCHVHRGTYMRVYGADGCFEITGESFDSWKPAGATDADEAEMIAKYAGGNSGAVSANPNLVLGHDSMVNDMIDAVINDRDPQVGPVEAMKAVRIVNAVYESQRTGKAVYFD